MRSSMLKGATLVLAACFAAIAQAQPAFPSRPVSLVLPSAPGDPTDLIARVLQPRMSERLRQPFLVPVKEDFVLVNHHVRAGTGRDHDRALCALKHGDRVARHCSRVRLKSGVVSRLPAARLL